MTMALEALFGGGGGGIGSDLSGALGGGGGTPSEIPYNPNRQLTYSEGSQMTPLDKQTSTGEGETASKEEDKKKYLPKGSKSSNPEVNNPSPIFSEPMQGGASNDMTAALLAALMRG